jgi:hypothetical protein
MRPSLIGALASAVVLSLPVSAQSPAAGTILPPAQQIAAATSAAPAELRAGAAVLGYDASKKLVKLREGTNDMVCLANNPEGKQFHVACYHKLLEPFMARGRALRAEGVKDPQVDTVRFKEITSGALKMPSTPSALYTLTGPPKSVDATGAKWLYVVYIPGATTASTGITEKPATGVPWIMYPGTPKAHIMFFTGM